MDEWSFVQLFSYAELLFDTIVSLGNWMTNVSTWVIVTGADSVTGLETVTFTGSLVSLLIGSGLTFFLGYRLVKFFTDLLL